jgi:ABC-type dipeptide/oligopeptide/nickel transport system ATPase component
LSVENIVREVRAEISRLQQVLVLLGETGHGVSVKKAAIAATTDKPRRKMSASARRRIAAAQRARWAKVRAGKK